MQHPRHGRSMSHMCPECVFIHGQCNHSASVLQQGLEESWTRGGVGGWWGWGTLALKWVFCGVLFVESELSWALLLWGCHGEKHRLLCNKIILEKKFPRIFF